MKNQLSNKMSILIAALTVMISMNTSRASAKDDFNIMLDETDRSFQLYQLKNDHDDLRVGRSKAGVVLSTVTSAAAVAFISVGAAELAQDRRSDTSFDLGVGGAVGRINLSIGAAMLVPGIIGTAISSKHLRENKKKQVQLQERIRILEAENERVSIAHGVPQKAALVRF